jgi:hypothetical protein
MKPRTVRRTYGVLRAVLRFAVDEDHIVRTPGRRISLPAVIQERRPEVDPRLTRAVYARATTAADRAAAERLGAAFRTRRGADVVQPLRGPQADAS